jgi:hypothetical protein
MNEKSGCGFYQTRLKLLTHLKFGAESEEKESQLACNRETVLLLSDEDQTTPQNGIRVLWDVHVAPVNGQEVNEGPPHGVRFS